MSDPNSSLYIPLLRSLELLSDEFRFAAQKHPSIRYQYFTYFDDPDLEDQHQRLSKAKPSEEKIAIINGGPKCSPNPSPQEWQAFVAANHETYGKGWNDWDGPSDGRFFGRFYGNPQGWEDFRSLAESAFLTVCEFNDHLDRCDGHNGWMEILCELGQNSPTPLLRAEGCSVRSVMTDLPAEAEIYSTQWADDAQGDRYPVDPICFELAHDVFVSSIAAIRYMVEPESILLIGEEIGYSPINWPLVGNTEPEEEAGPEAEVRPEKGTGSEMETERAETPFRRFEFDGATWHIEFSQDGEVESRPFTKNDLGLQYMRWLVMQPSKLLKARELEGDPSEAVARYAEGEEDLDGFEMGRSKGFQPRSTRDTKLDEQGRQLLTERLARITEELKAAGGDPELKEDLERQAEFFQSQLRGGVGRGGRLRPMGAGTEDEKARKRVGASIKRAKELIAKSMPKCGQHLKECVLGENGGFVYRPWLQR